MDDEVVAKICGIIVGLPGEAETVHLFSLLRKLIERLPKNEQADFALLHFYCDWTLHTRLNRASAAKLISEMQVILDRYLLPNTPSATFQADVTEALSLQHVRTQMNELIRRFDGGANAISEVKWDLFAMQLTEIVAHVPLERRDGPAGGSQILRLMVARLPSSSVIRDGHSDQVTYCMTMTLSNTTTIIVPLDHPAVPT